MDADDSVAFTRTRRDINGRIKEYLTDHDIPFEMEQQPDNRTLYRIEGELLTTGEAADKYLPGGFAGNFGKA